MRGSRRKDHSLGEALRTRVCIAIFSAPVGLNGDCIILVSRCLDEQSPQLELNMWLDEEMNLLSH